MGTVCWGVVMRGLGDEGVHAESPADVESALAKARDATGEESSVRVPAPAAGGGGEAAAIRSRSPR